MKLSVVTGIVTSILAGLFAFASADCTQSGLQPCGEGLGSCVSKSGGDHRAICQCRGTYDQCYADAGCPKAAVDAVVQACEHFLCPASVCGVSLKTYA
jgi:hypothetical protein